MLPLWPRIGEPSFQETPLIGLQDEGSSKRPDQCQNIEALLSTSISQNPAATCNAHDILPGWEDPQGQNGGTWLYQCQNKLSVNGGERGRLTTDSPRRRRE